MLCEIKQKVKVIPQHLWDKNQLVDQGMRDEKPNVGHTAIDSDLNNDSILSSFQLSINNT